MIGTIAAIGCGGALGAVARHGVNLAALHWGGAGFPWGTFAVNIAGSLAMGILVALFAHVWQPSAEFKSFLTTGVLGGFTTFSTFSLDAANLLESGQGGLAVFYMIASVALSVGALFLGLLIVRSLAG